jgi:hypothetical protein
MTMAEDRDFLPEPQQDWDLRAFVPQPGLAQDLGRGPWLTAGAGAALISLGILINLLITDPAGVAIDVITAMVGTALVLWSAAVIGAKVAARHQHRKNTPYPVNLPTEDRPRLGRLAVEFTAFDTQRDAITDRVARKGVTDALSVPIGSRPFFLPERLRRHSLQPGVDALRIVTSRAWADPWLSDHRLDIDPLNEATEIYRYLNQIAIKVNEFTDKAERHRGTPAERSYRQYVADLTADLSAVRGRAQALAGYQDQIDRLSHLLRAEDAMPQIETDGDIVRDLMAETRRHELAAEHLDRQRQELQQIERGLREIRSLLAEDQTLRLPGQQPNPGP